MGVKRLEDLAAFQLAIEFTGRCGAALTNLRKSLEPFTKKGKRAARGTP